jgi:hypothetical protein
MIGGVQITCGVCKSIFLVCRKCFRRQRYCSTPCIQIGYKEAKRRANRKHAKSIEAKLDACDRSRRYRQRLSFGFQNSVTDKSSAFSPDKVNHSHILKDHCIRCGQKVFKTVGGVSESLELFAVPPD